VRPGFFLVSRGELSAGIPLFFPLLNQIELLKPEQFFWKKRAG